MHKQKIFSDVIELIGMVFHGLSKDCELESFTNLYQSYRYLVKAYDSGTFFKDGTFSHDIHLPIYQETESFKTPEAKWNYFVSRELKTFNDDLLKFIRSCVMIDFPDTSEDKKWLLYNLLRYSCFIPEKKNDNKLKFTQKHKMIKYQYMLFESNITTSMRDDLLKNIEYNIDELRRELPILLEKMKEFKKFLDVYFELNLTPQKMTLKFAQKMQISAKGLISNK